MPILFHSQLPSLTRMGSSYVEQFLFVLPSATTGSSGFSPSPLQDLACRKGALLHLSWTLVYTVCQLCCCITEGGDQ